jgi:hypothetical protein
VTRVLSINDILAERANEERDHIELKMPLGEMITTSAGLMSLIEKVRVDVEFGQADVPTLYEPIYETIPGPFPGRAVQLGENVLEASVVFLEKFEAGEVVFGVLAKGAPATVPLQTYAAGFEYTEDMVEWDNTWELEMFNRAFGRAYNALLNHLHFSPILTYSYTAANQVPFSAVGATAQEKTLNTFRDAYVEAVSAVPQRSWDTILASEVNRFQIEDALLTPVRDAQGNPLPRVPVQTIIYYDGMTITVGNKSYQYPGVTPGKCYGIFTKQRFKEFVHHGLRVDADNRDISRLVEAQIVGRTRRGLYADVAQSVEEIALA